MAAAGAAAAASLPLRTDSALAMDAAGWNLARCWRTSRRSYSLTARRRSSRAKAKRKTAMQEPAKTAGEVMRQPLWRKQASVV